MMWNSRWKAGMALAFSTAAMTFAASTQADDRVAYVQGHFADYFDSGLGIAGGYDVTPQVHVFGEYSIGVSLGTTTETIFGTSMTVTEEGEGDFMQLGGSYIIPMDNGARIEVGGSLVDHDITDGIAGHGIYRMQVNPELGFFGKGEIQFLDDDTELVLGGGVDFAVTPEISLFGGLDLYPGDIDEQFIRIGGRYNF